MTNVYVDAFNFYYGCLRNTNHKWVNLRTLMEAEFPTHQIQRIRYFTADVRATTADPQQPRRQKAYLDALATVPGVEIHKGHFARNKLWMERWNPQPGETPTVRVWKNEEKGSDVNIAAYLLLDAFHNDCSEIVMVSNDTDLAHTIQLFRQNFAIPVNMLYPCSPPRSPSMGLRTASGETGRPRVVSVANLAASQFPDPVVTADGREIFKPAAW